MPNTNIANISSIRMAEQSATPSTPASNFSSIYMKSDGLYVVDDAGVTTGPLIDASGGGVGSAVILAPDSIDRNLVQPSGDYHGIVLKNNASQTEEILEHHDSAGSILSSIDFRGKYWLRDNSATTAPIRLHEISATPGNPIIHDIYLDDGTNTSSGNPGFRRYNGSGWEDINPATSPPLTTKGDLWGFSTVDARIPVGANDEILVADSTAALGVAYKDVPTAIANKMPSDEYTLNETSDYTETSTTFVDVDATNLALTITTNGGDVLVGFHGSFNNGSGDVFLDVAVDGTRDGGDDGYIRVRTASGVTQNAASFTRTITGLSAASHTFKLQWKVTGGTETLYAGAGTTNVDLHPQFWVRELP